MIKLLAPLGLLGLLGVVALIIIYIIKPNYQQKFISSTFVWKLSLKYRKRRIPINKLRNLLIIICQILILTIAAMILTRPSEVFFAEENKQEYIIVIDSAASMRTSAEGKTRFERAIEGATARSYEILDQDGIVSIIIADETPDFLTKPAEYLDDGTLVAEAEVFRQVTAAKSYSLAAEMERLVAEDTCSYGKSDVDSAMVLCQQLLDLNPTAKVFLYTDTAYTNVGSVEVISVNESAEWNAGILQATAIEQDYYYNFSIDVGYFASSENPQQTKVLDVEVKFLNVNAYDKNSLGGDYTVSYSVNCTSGQTKTIFLKTADEDIQEEVENIEYYNLEDDGISKINSFGSIEVSVTAGAPDSNFLDDKYFIFGNQKEVIKVQYSSELPNTFVTSALAVLDDIISYRWDIQITEVKKGEEFATMGFDFYIFEHEMPTTMPTDGAVLMINPTTAPQASGFDVLGEYANTVNGVHRHVFMMPNDVQSAASQVLSGWDFGDNHVGVSQYQRLRNTGGYEVLTMLNDVPAIMVKNNGADKAAVISYSLHYSNMPVQKEWMLFMINLFGYFFPGTVDTTQVEVNETVSITSMSSLIEVTYSSYDNVVLVDTDIVWGYEDLVGEGENFTVEQTLTMPGVYTITQMSYFDREFKENIFVAMASVESNIWRQTSLEAPVPPEWQKEYYGDLLLYLAAALVFFLFAEWLLHVHENA